MLHYLVFGVTLFDVALFTAPQLNVALLTLHYIKGATKSCHTHYPCVVIILFKRVYVGLHFLPIILENYFFVLLCFMCFLF